MYSHLTGKKIPSNPGIFRKKYLLVFLLMDFPYISKVCSNSSKNWERWVLARTFPLLYEIFSADLPKNEKKS